MKKKETLWIETFSGKKINPFHPDPEDIDIEDIAHSLAMQCRFNGHCSKFYSVAEHCINTAVYVINSTEEKTNYAPLFALLHDATEAYLCDIPRPLKPFIRDYINWEKKLASTIFAKFANSQPSVSEWELVMQADNALLAIEAEKLAHSKGIGWDLPEATCSGVRINCYTWKRAKENFLEYFFSLKEKF